MSARSTYLVSTIDFVSIVFGKQCQSRNSSPGSFSIEPAQYEPSFHVVLHQPEIPPNTGAIGRSCVALQAKLWLVRPLGFRIDEKTLRRAGLDYWKHLNWQVVDNWEDLLDRARETSQLARMWMFSKTAERDFRDPDFQCGDWLVFGCETSGLPSSLLTEPERNLRIPTFGNVRSLNLASSVAVAGYEVARQTRLFEGG